MIGQADRALRVLDAFFVTLGFALGAWLLMQFVRGALNWVVHTSRFQNISVFQKHGSSIAAKVSLLFDFFIVWLFLLTILINWQVFSTPAEATKGILSWGFTMESQRVTIGLLLAAIAIFYGSVVVSSTVQTLLLEEVFPKRNIEPGVGLSISRLTQYGLLSVGFLFALATLGISLTNLTILGGALGVGIGFGLQAIVNNFASGLILLFERPIRVHDYIVVGDLFAEIKSIGLRSTVVRTFDGSEIVIPNSDLITNQVTNWTLSERHMRLKIQVGVAYGSDVALVKEKLMACAAGNAWVLNTPAPTVLFLNFGESSLDFELRFWIANVDHMMSVASSLRFAIDQKFREAGIEISFPQRDLHIRSVDESAGQILSRSEEHRSDPAANPKNEKA